MPWSSWWAAGKRMAPASPYSPSPKRSVVIGILFNSTRPQFLSTTREFRTATTHAFLGRPTNGLPLTCEPRSEPSGATACYAAVYSPSSGG